MQSRSTILNAGILDELSKSIDETVSSQHVIQYQLNQMLRKEQEEVRNKNRSVPTL